MWYADRRYMKAHQSTKTLRGIDVDATVVGFNIENLTAKQALMDAKDKHACRFGRPRKALTASKKNSFRMFGTRMLKWLTSLLLPNRLITVNQPVCGKFYGGWVGQLHFVASCWSSTTEGASDVSPFHLFTLPTARAVSLLCWVVLFVLVFVVFGSCFACAVGIFLIIVADVSR